MRASSQSGRYRRSCARIALNLVLFHSLAEPHNGGPALGGPGGYVIGAELLPLADEVVLRKMGVRVEVARRFAAPRNFDRF
jgi:hypothetical protein